MADVSARTAARVEAQAAIDALVGRLLRDAVAPGGRLIVGPVSGAEVDAAVAAFAAAGIPQPGVAEATDRDGKTRQVVWAGAGRRAGAHAA